MKQKTVILITGPTASGKTALAIEAAQHFSTSIISADSRQCFHELNIGVAKPSAIQLQTVKHYFISNHSIQDSVTAATFESEAIQAAQEIFQNNNVLVMAGGTGLYIRAFLEGLDAVPEVPPKTREYVMQGYDTNGMDWLRSELAARDPLYYSTGEMQNPQRMMRALEVMLATGSSIRTYQQKRLIEREFEVIKLGVRISKDNLHEQINHRVDEMIRHGLVEEVTSLVPYRHLNALQTVGYTEIFDYIDGKCLLGEAIDRIKINTRHYAKRQLTWFKKDREISWMDPEEIRTYLAGFKI